MGKQDFAHTAKPLLRDVARQNLCCATPHGKGRTAVPSMAKVSLSCTSPTLHGKCFAVRPELCRAGKLCRAPSFFAVRADFTVRRSRSRACGLCRGPAMCRGTGLCRAPYPQLAWQRHLQHAHCLCQEHRLATHGAFAVCMHTTK
jgi:hypothetical protein